MVQSQSFQDTGIKWSVLSPPLDHKAFTHNIYVASATPHGFSVLPTPSDPTLSWVLAHLQASSSLRDGVCTGQGSLEQQNEYIKRKLIELAYKVRSR